MSTTFVIEYLHELFTNHGVSSSISNDKLIVTGKEKIKIRARITPNEFPSGRVLTRLDVGVLFEDGNELFESFGDYGNSLEESVKANLSNFTRNSFHVILSALQDKGNNSETSTETWVINNREWKAYIGNWGLKNSSDKDIVIPENLFQKMVDQIHEVGLTKDINFIRFFCSCWNYKIQDIEFMINNENILPIQEYLSKIKWDLKDEVYTIRLFLIVRNLF